jgi:hypothetical protein
MFFSTNYNPEPPLPRREKIRHRNSGFEHLASKAVKSDLSLFAIVDLNGW